MEKYKVINRLTLQLLVAVIVVHKVYNCVVTVLYLC